MLHELNCVGDGGRSVSKLTTRSASAPFLEQGGVEAVALIMPLWRQRTRARPRYLEQNGTPQPTAHDQRMCESQYHLHCNVHSQRRLLVAPQAAPGYLGTNRVLATQATARMTLGARTYLAGPCDSCTSTEIDCEVYSA